MVPRDQLFCDKSFATLGIEIVYKFISEGVNEQSFKVFAPDRTNQGPHWAMHFFDTRLACVAQRAGKNIDAVS